MEHEPHIEKLSNDELVQALEEDPDNVELSQEVQRRLGEKGIFIYASKDADGSLTLGAIVPKQEGGDVA